MVMLRVLRVSVVQSNKPNLSQKSSHCDASPFEVSVMELGKKDARKAALPQCIISPRECTETQERSFNTYSYSYNSL